MHPLRTFLAPLVALLVCCQVEAASNPGQAVGNGLKNLIGPLNPDIVSGVVGGLATALAQVGNGLDKSLQVLTSSNSKLVDIIVCTVSGVLTTVAKIVESVPTSLFKILSFVPFVGDMFDKKKNETIKCNKECSLHASLPDALEKLTQCIKKPVGDLVEGLSGILRQVVKILLTLATGLRKAIEAHKLGDTVSKLLEAVGSTLKEALRLLGKLVKPIIDLIKNVLPLLSCILSTVFKFLASVLHGFLVYVKCLLKAIF